MEKTRQVLLKLQDELKHYYTDLTLQDSSFGTALQTYGLVCCMLFSEKLTLLPSDLIYLEKLTQDLHKSWRTRPDADECLEKVHDYITTLISTALEKTYA